MTAGCSERSARARAADARVWTGYALHGPSSNIPLDTLPFLGPRHATHNGDLFAGQSSISQHPCTNDDNDDGEEGVDGEGDEEDCASRPHRRAATPVQPPRAAQLVPGSGPRVRARHRHHRVLRARDHPRDRARVLLAPGGIWFGLETSLVHTLSPIPSFTFLWPLQNSLFPPAPESAIHAPISLIPTPIPRHLFSQALNVLLNLQRAYNTLYARVALDVSFLDDVMGPGGVADVDDFTSALWSVWKRLRDEGVPPVCGGIASFRRVLTKAP